MAMGNKHKKTIFMFAKCSENVIRFVYIEVYCPVNIMKEGSVPHGRNHLTYTTSAIQPVIADKETVPLGAEAMAAVPYAAAPPYLRHHIQLYSHVWHPAGF